MSAIAEMKKNIRRFPYHSLAVLFLLTISFYVSYIFSFFLYSGSMILQYFESRPQITAFFTQKVTDEQIAQVAEALRQEQGVTDVLVTTKKDALELFQKENENDTLVMSFITEDVLPPSVEVRAQDAQTLRRVAEKMAIYQDLTEEVVFQEDLVKEVERWVMAIRMISIEIVGMLFVMSFVSMSIVMSMKIATKKREIVTMKLFGAKFGYIYTPFFLEGVMIGILSALLGCGVAYVRGMYGLPWVLEMLPSIPLIPLPYWFVGAQLGVGVVGGSIIGMFSSYIATKRG